MYDGMNASISRKCYFELADGYEDSANEEYQVSAKILIHFLCVRQNVFFRDKT